MVHVFKGFICFERLEFQFCRQLKMLYITACIIIVYMRIFEMLLTRMNPVFNLNTCQLEKRKRQSVREILAHC